MKRDVLPPIIAFVASVILVGLVRAYAIRHSVLDRPSARSSHAVPTPRGGGVGLVLAHIVAVIAAFAIGGSSWQLGLALCGAVIVMIVGWLDDRNALPIASRFTAHVVTGLTLLPLAFSVSPFAAWAIAWAAIWALVAIAAINAVNFMDGIDGLVASQVLIVSLYCASVSGGPARVFASSLGLACAGFLVWNWAPARIFMGDAGSGPLGFLLTSTAMLTIASNHRSAPAVLLALIPLAGDSTLTLLRRLRKGDRVTLPHRTHLYQRMANGGLGHARVSLGYGLATLSGIAAGTLAVTVPGPAGSAIAGAYVGGVVAVTAVLARKYPVE